MNAVTISYCGDHTKGPQYHGYKLPGNHHSEMLRELVKYVRREVNGMIVVCATGMSGSYESAEESNNMWEVFRNARIVSHPKNFGYSEGANYSIRQAVDAAYALGCHYLVHTCEDVIPNKGTTSALMDRLANENLVYIGERWRETELSTQFFGASVDFLHERFDAMTKMPPEAYMASLVGERPHALIPRLYRHSHTYSEWRQWMTEVMG